MFSACPLRQTDTSAVAITRSIIAQRDKKNAVGLTDLLFGYYMQDMLTLHTYRPRHKTLCTK